jgi:hypothetical protein
LEEMMPIIINNCNRCFTEPSFVEYDEEFDAGEYDFEFGINCFNCDYGVHGNGLKTVIELWDTLNPLKRPQPIQAQLNPTASVIELENPTAWAWLPQRLARPYNILSHETDRPGVTIWTHYQDPNWLVVITDSLPIGEVQEKNLEDFQFAGDTIAVTSTGLSEALEVVASAWLGELGEAIEDKDGDDGDDLIG